jgi:hypothetical protein
LNIPLIAHLFLSQVNQKAKKKRKSLLKNKRRQQPQCQHYPNKQVSQLLEVSQRKRE